MSQWQFRPAFRTAVYTTAGVVVALWFSSSAVAGDLTLQARQGEPLPGLDVNQLDRFFKGRERFEHDFLSQEGLGPTFNQTSCAICHSAPAVGGSGTIAVTRFGALNIFTEEFDPLEQYGGSLHQMGAIIDDCFDDINWIQNQIEFPWDWIENQRITNSAFGGGLIEAIPDEAILAHATYYGGEPWTGSPPAGISSDISGRAHKVHSFEDDPPIDRVGRMGWKAQVATVLTFSADAARNEMGITNRFLTQAPAPMGDLELLEWCENLEGINDLAPHPNDQAHLDPFGENIEFIDRITDFQRFLAPPPQTPKSGMTGEQIFNDIGCAQCHIPSWTTRDDATLEEAIRNQTIRPYSDFLLHDMGLAGDSIEQGDGLMQFMRTPALWGLRDRDPLWHDGRVGGGSFADRIHLQPGNNAIHWHNALGSTAQVAAQEFMALSTEDKDLVVAFLNSLGRWEFDYNGDVIIDDIDFQAMIDCYTGPRGSYVDPSENPMDDPCAVFDIAQNGSIDHTDFELFLTVYEGEMEECELWLALADGVSPGIDVPVPPKCLTTTCVGDLTNSGSVGVPDLLALLGAWGPNPGHPADLTGSGSVGVADLLLLLGNWGPCPD